jgi:RNA recognition motif-containing protein
LSFDLTREAVLEHFATVGSVRDIVMPVDRATGRPRGFAFVEYDTEEGAAKALSELNGTELGGRSIKVDEARERVPRMPRDFGPPPGDRGGRQFKRKGSRRNIRRQKRGF